MVNNSQLYEQLMLNISNEVSYAINEAYDNALLESFNTKEFIDKVIDLAIKTTFKTAKAINDANIPAKALKAARVTKKIIVLIAKDIQKSKGYAAVKDFLNALKERIKATIKKHNTLTIKQLLYDIKVVTIALGMFGSGYFAHVVQQAFSDINSMEKTEILANDKLADNDVDVTIEDEDSVADPKVDTTAIRPINQVVKAPGKLPVEYAKTLQGEAALMTPTTECTDFIKNDEVLCQIPYFATNIEKRAGMITIGYGHIICDNWKDPKSTWYFPSTISEARRKEIKATIIKMAKANQILISSVKVNSKGAKYNANVVKGAKDIITIDEANKFFKKDIEVADRRVRITLGITESANRKYNNNKLINSNVKYYCYYNQHIYDMLLSCAFNSGAWSDDVAFIKSLINCRYDKANNCINASDFDVTFKKFLKGNGRNIDRRFDEFTLFVKNQKNTLISFTNCIA